MNHEQQLQLQAYLDGELSERDARKVETLLASNPEAEKLFAELQFTSKSLHRNEPEHKLPESREFYWSKIEREIRNVERNESRDEDPIPVFGWLQRILIPLTSVALVAFIAVVAMKRSDNDFQKPVVAEAWEVEAPTGEMGTMTFRSESEKMTVVWLYSKDDSGIASDDSISNFYE